MKPYDRPVEAASERMLSPELYRFLRSEASLARSAPVTLAPFFSVSVTQSSRCTEVAPQLPYLRHDHASATERLPTPAQKISTFRIYATKRPFWGQSHARATRS